MHPLSLSDILAPISTVFAVFLAFVLNWRMKIRIKRRKYFLAQFNKLIELASSTTQAKIDKKESIESEKKIWNVSFVIGEINHHFNTGLLVSDAISKIDNISGNFVISNVNLFAFKKLRNKLITQLVNEIDLFIYTWQRIKFNQEKHGENLAAIKAYFVAVSTTMTMIIKSRKRDIVKTYNESILKIKQITPHIAK